MARITHHPILPIPDGDDFSFRFDGTPVQARRGEMISSALFAAGIRVFGRHAKDGSPQGIFCANGQCAQCLVMADGVPVKACMTPAAPGMVVSSIEGLPALPETSAVPSMSATELVDIDVLILGGGPAGMSAALELAEWKVPVLLVDDKDRLGGKLVLQTHRFFGSTDAVYAGTRGIDIGSRLASRLAEYESIQVWLNTTAVAVFSDRLVGVIKEGKYLLIRPRVLLVSTGAREKSLVFQGNTLPGVYGAGAFQTLVNRDLVKAADRLFVVGGGNVGLIAAYHALQAGIDVVGLVEALPECGGYKVHRDKLARMGVPIYTSHTVLSANGKDSVESVTIAGVDADFRSVAGTEKTFACDTILIAVGLDPVDEFTHAARKFGLPVHAAGDAEEIAEASAAIFSGRMAGRRMALELGACSDPVPDEWARMSEILKSRPGKIVERASAKPSDGSVPTESHAKDTRSIDSSAKASAVPEMFHTSETPRNDLPHGQVIPVFHCFQEIPCNPCASVCPQGLIRIDASDIRHVPEVIAADAGKACIGCAKCVMICPGLAITLVDTRGSASRPLVTIPFEFGDTCIRPGDEVVAMDSDGNVLGDVQVSDVRSIPGNDRTVLIKVESARDIAHSIAGIRMQEAWVGQPLPEAVQPLEDSDIVCRCERVTAGEIRTLIRAGHRDMNEIKALTRAGMGACGGKTCQALILRLFRECGVPYDEVTAGTPRPLFVEVPLGAFAGVSRSRAVDGEERS
jgi:sarcosine oxidase, subunit alpha